MKAYLRAFVNFEQDDWAKLLPIAKFAYNNAKIASTGHTPLISTTATTIELTTKKTLILALS